MGDPARPEPGGAPLDVPLGAGWVVRWDTAADERPRVFHGSGPAGDAALFRAPSGDIALLDGYLFDRGPSERGSDAARLAAAHARLGDAWLDGLAGGFAAVIWDAARRRLTVARDALGLHPCFYRWNGRVLLVAAALDAIVARREVAARVDRVVLAEYVQNRLSAPQVHETFYEGVRRLPPAHVLRTAGSAPEISRYWDPVPSGFDWATPRELAGFDDLLARAVTRCRAVGADSIALSGGFDSVSLAALDAAGRGAGRPLHAVSLRFTGTPSDEGATQAAVARALGMPQTLLTLEEALGGEGVVDAALALSAASPSPVLSPWQAAYSGILRRAAGLGLGRLLMGTGGDDLLTVDPSHGADRLAALDVRGLWRFCRACQRTSPLSAARVVRGVLWDHAAAPELARLAGRLLGRVSPTALAWARRRRERGAAPEWAAPVDAELAARVARRRERAPAGPGRGEGAYVRTIRGLSLAPLLLIERDQSEAWARQLGFRFLFPYFDRDLVALSLRIRPEDLIAGGRHKAPLRRLVATRLPSVALHGKKVDFTAAVHEVLRPAGLAAWRRMGGPAALADLGLIDADGLGRFVRDYGAGRHASWLQVWVALSTEAWLRARAGLAHTPDQEEAAA